MKYFTDCKTIAEVKTQYKKLAKVAYPDRGGDTATMQAINSEYSFACSKIAHGAGLTAEQADTEIRLSEEYRQVIEKISHLPGLVIEIVGNWIWVTGETRPAKDTLKEAGFYFASKKRAWYYRNELFKTRGDGAPLEEIRRRYGSETIQRKNNRKALEQD